MVFRRIAAHFAPLISAAIGANALVNSDKNGSEAPSCRLKNLEQSFPYSKIFEMSILSIVNLRVSIKAISKSLAQLKSCS